MSGRVVINVFPVILDKLYLTENQLYNVIFFFEFL